MNKALWSWSLAVLAASATAHATPIPSSFKSTAPDRTAIQTLLDTYAKAVSTKDQARFEMLLLNRSIPFSNVTNATTGNGSARTTRRNESFRKGVFEGPPFIQHFQDIQQDGALAQVSLVFVNASKRCRIWGWKTLQLLKIGGHWKIASEFYTGHSL